MKVQRFIPFVLAPSLLLLSGCEREEQNAVRSLERAPVVSATTTPIPEEPVEPDAESPFSLEPAREHDRGAEIEAAESVLAAEEEEITAEDVRQATLLAIEAARKYASQREQELHKEVDEQYADFQKRLEEMKARAESLKARAKKKITDELTVLDEQAKNSGLELSELERRSAETVSRLNQRLDQLLSQLTGAEGEHAEKPDSTSPKTEQSTETIERNNEDVSN